MKRRLTDEELSAYVLNELDDADREKIAAVLRDDKAARDNVEALKRSTEAARKALEPNRHDGLDDFQRQAILSCRTSMASMPSMSTGA